MQHFELTSKTLQTIKEIEILLIVNKNAIQFQSNK